MKWARLLLSDSLYNNIVIYRKCSNLRRGRLLNFVSGDGGGALILFFKFQPQYNIVFLSNERKICVYGTYFLGKPKKMLGVTCDNLCELSSKGQLLLCASL